MSNTNTNNTTTYTTYLPSYYVWSDEGAGETEGEYFGEGTSSFEEALSEAESLLPRVSKSGEVAVMAYWEGGPSLLCVRFYGTSPKKPVPERDLAWEREIAREAGMLGGLAAYNEVMGY